MNWGISDGINRVRTRTGGLFLGRFGSLWTIATLIALCAVSPAVLAQGRGGGGWGSVWSAGVDTEDLEHMTVLFELDEDQQMVIGSLIDGYRGAFNEGVDKVREQMRQARDEARGQGDWQIMREVMEESTTAWRSEADQLETQLMADIRSMLTPDQDKLWSKFERDRLRRTTLTRGSRLSGEGVDVTRLVADLELDEENQAKVEPLLEAYADELDPLLKDRNSMNEEIMENMAAFFEGDDPEEAERQWRRVQDRRISIRTLNMQYVEAIAAQLPLEEGDLLRLEYKQESFPRIYRPTEADRYLEQVVQMESITNDQVENLTRISEDYGRQIEEVNAQLAAAEREREESGEGLPFMMRGAGGRRNGMFFGGDDGTGGGINAELERSLERMRELRDHKDQIVEQQLTAIASVLTPDQLAQAPKPDPAARRQQMMEEMRQRRDDRMRRMRGEEGEAQGGG